MRHLNHFAAAAILILGLAQDARSSESTATSADFAASEIARGASALPVDADAEVSCGVVLARSLPTASEDARSNANAVVFSDCIAGPVVFSDYIVGPVVFSDYIVDKTDNICGLEVGSQLTNPAKVDYDDLMDATPEIRKMKKEKIDEDSAKGIQLRTAAEERVRKACEKVMNSDSHCSVWKKIKRRDGKKVTDITDDVKKQITES